MSNTLAIATVTHALCGYLARSLDVGIAVNVNPQKPPADPPSDPMISVFLYQVTPNGSLRNADAPTRGPDGAVLRKPQAALDLHYLISFYGEEASALPQRLLGSVVRALHEDPILARKDIEDAVLFHPHLAGSDLAASPHKVRFTPAQLDLDDQSKLWSMLFQTPYAVSLHYLASLVLVDGRSTPQAGKPVLRRHIHVEPFVRPVVEQVLSLPPGADQGTPPDTGPITADRDLVLIGLNLGRPDPVALVGGLVAPVRRISDAQVVLGQPPNLPPGVHTVQLRYPVQLDPAGEPRPLLESTAAPYVRRPRVLRAERRGQGVWLRLDIPVEADQRAQLLLDGTGARARSYQFTAPFPLVGVPEPVRELIVPIKNVVAGRYLVRVQVDGAQSPLDFAGGAFTGPSVEITG
ncbi:DUF4255 domain-containing protein [Crossiella cryophila]|uniref:Pvc16 N-terminal domain-containing protein n=1 Tax=Crossiella cryophila TaxID=43355 RepID=A0A7W7G0C2_9PSEU|nr:DUF4255 domain-containing protein [Crossiella cryophila]MBB4682089.1 hypothetical protein [Crossiella cryophila]